MNQSEVFNVSCSVECEGGDVTAFASDLTQFLRRRKHRVENLHIAMHRKRRPMAKKKRPDIVWLHFLRMVEHNFPELFFSNKGVRSIQELCALPPADVRDLAIKAYFEKERTLEPCYLGAYMILNSMRVVLYRLTGQFLSDEDLARKNFPEVPDWRTVFISSPFRFHSSLDWMETKSVHMLLSYSETDLRLLPKFGHARLSGVRRALEAHNLYLRAE